ncbi:glycogen debranching protein GlgX [bacterium]|nr:glycogen debranching protein GlgX [bacterium]
MNVRIEQDRDRAWIRFTGTLAGHLPQNVEEQIRGLLLPGHEIILDFTGVERLSSHALRRLILVARYARSVGCRLAPTGVPQDLHELLVAAGFEQLLTRADTVGNLPLLHVRSATPFRLDAYPTHSVAGFGVRRGEALPFGATLTPRGVNFALFSRHAETVTLLLYRPGVLEPFAELLYPDTYRVGDVWAMTVFDLDVDDLEYAYRLTGPWKPDRGLRFRSDVALLDPMAQSLAGTETWGCPSTITPLDRRVMRGRIVPHDFDWNGDRALQLPVEDLVIYEMHVRGFTKSETSGVEYPGTYAGLREKIPHLKSLGVNCVELMPIFEFDECENLRQHPETGERLVNYWGYSTVAFFAPKTSYAASGVLGMQSDELKTLVLEFHRAGIEVILDVVFNHTAELDVNGPTLSFRGIDDRVYYMLAPDGGYLNFSGCGNTLNCNHPVVREFVRNCLRHWVMEYHIDGFRFDLASILGRDSRGNPLSSPPLLESLARDPVLSHTKLIAEAWDAGGLYQVGTFPAFGRWMEWNGKYRDCARKFLRGDPGQAGEMAQRLIGSPDVYGERGPTASVNFVTCHDGFTMQDLYSYNEKHNWANGEENRDGTDMNDSWNCGVEGPTDDEEILSLRERMVRNALAMLFLSQGVPMLLMGDEMGRTQDGNNNTYCHDGPINWLDWSLTEHYADRLRFCQELIAFRQRHPALRHHNHAGQRQFQEADLLDVTWHGVEPHQPDWTPSSRSLALQLRLYSVRGLIDVLYLVFNMFWEPLDFRLPAAPDGWIWRRVIDTAAAGPDDILTNESAGESFLHKTRVNVAGRSVTVFVAQAQ